MLRTLTKTALLAAPVRAAARAAPAVPGNAKDSAMMRVKRLRRSVRCESADAKSESEQAATRISALSADNAASMLARDVKRKCLCLR